jgi:hypothetical protein
MPCYQVNLISVEFKAKNVNVLELAAKELGWTFQHAGKYVNIGAVTIDLESQQATTFSGQSSINALKVEYSRQAVLLSAKKKKWFVKAKSKTQMELRRY